MEKYGINYGKDIFKKVATKLGVENVSQLSSVKQKIKNTCLEKWGVESINQVQEIKDKKRKSCLEKYGVDWGSKIPESKKKMMEKKIKNGSFSKSNSSYEATIFIRNYIKENNYCLSQVCFSDVENELFEWGYYFKEKWRLFDLVVFEKGYRGNINHILEILEFHGPFHYEEKDVKDRGEEKAYPWKTNKVTIKESYQVDQDKKEFSELYSKKFTIIKPNKYYKNEIKRVFR